MATTYFEHESDMGIVGRGATVEQSFEAAAKAVFSIITNLEAIRPNTMITFEFEEADLEFALVIWLNLILAKARELGMVFGRFDIQHRGNQWFAKVSGEKWHDGMERGVEVKGATLTMLSVKQVGAMWEARCVVDV